MREGLNQFLTESVIAAVAQRTWSERTFGDRGPLAALKHLARECREAHAAWEAGDTAAFLTELADLRILLYDATWRAGLSETDLTGAVLEKMAVNIKREYPAAVGDTPTFHKRPKRVYVSAHDSDWAKTVARHLTKSGFEVVSVWHDQPARDFNPFHNFTEIDRADVFVLLASPTYVPGGKFVEAGYAIGRDIPGVSLNPTGFRENRFMVVFPHVTTVEALVTHLEGKPCPTSDE